jgi:hypothetical protein
MHPIATMCRVLGVSPGGYYARLKRPPSARAQADGELSARIAAIHRRSQAVALVIRSSVLLNPADGLGAYSSPVAYFDDRQFEQRFAQVAENISSEAEFLRAQEREDITNRIFQMLRFATLSTKHTGVAEEKEWRILYVPTLARISIFSVNYQFDKMRQTR